MQPPLVEISDQPNPDAERLLGNGLAAFNEAITGANDRQPLTVLVRDPGTRQILGGITGKTSLGMAFLTCSTCPMPCAARAWAANCCKPSKTKPGAGVA